MSKGVAIVLSWPETLCKQADAWYDPLMTLLGFNRNGYYKVGHAAIVLIEKDTCSCTYYDFGRYHAPVGYGRVRSAHTDHDLIIQTSAVFDEDGTLANEESILHELYDNNSCHGSGPIVSCHLPIDHTQSIQAIRKLQDKVFLPYGPIVWNGTNCSRFVARVLLRSNISLMLKLRLIFQPSISPSPIGNVRAIENTMVKTGYSISEVPTEQIEMEVSLS